MTFSAKGLLRFFCGVKVFALVGASGTGKSFRARLLAEKYSVDLIVDDGLLICGDKILAGKSAKREKNYMAAVRCALFDNEEHCSQVRKALEKAQFRRVLLLGTSVKMVRRIASRLRLPMPRKVIGIEEVASRSEIEAAMLSRQVEGKHVIPVPSIEVAKKYPSIFYDKIRVFFRRTPISPKTQVFEKSLVRTEFTKHGCVEISEAALMQLVSRCVADFDSAMRVLRMSVRSEKGAYRVKLHLAVPFGQNLPARVYELQRRAVASVEKCTGILLEEFDIVLDKIV